MAIVKAGPMIISFRRSNSDKKITALISILKTALQEIAKPVLYAICWGMTLAALFAGLEPLALVGLFFLYTFLASLYLYGTGQFTLAKSRTELLFLTVLAFAGYIILSSLWSAKAHVAIEKGMLVALIAIGVRLSLPVLDMMSCHQLRRCTNGIIIGLLLGLMLPLVEYATNYSALSFLASHLPKLTQSIGIEKQPPPSHFNTNITAISLFLWPTLLLAKTSHDSPTQKVFIIALLVAVLFLLYRTESATSQIAFIFAVAAYYGAQLSPVKIKLFARSLWILAVVGMVPIVMTMKLANMHTINSLPYSFKDRIHIWNYTAKLVHESPLLGIGVRSSRVLQKKPDLDARPSSTPRLVDHPGWHSHNMYLQTWYELGAVGVLFLLATGLLLLNAISRIELDRRPFAYATFCSFSIVAAFGYGMWQSWLLVTYGWSMVFILIGLRYNSRKNPGEIPATQQGQNP